MPIKGVHRIRKKLADGRIKFYYRTSRTGGVTFWECEGKPLDGKRLPPDFISAYEAACNLERGVSPGSFEQVFQDYQKRSAAYLRMKQKSRDARDKYLNGWLDMSLKKGQRAGSAPLAIFDRKEIVPYIIKHRDATWGHSPSVSDEAMFALSAFLRWCVGEGKLDKNKAATVPAVYKRPIDKARIWEPEEREAFLSTAQWQVQFFYELEEFVGLRLEDAVTLPLTAIKREHIIIPTGKSRGQNYAIVPLIPPLKSLLDRIEKKRKALKKELKLKAEPLTVLFNSRGLPWTPDGLATSFYRHRDDVLSADDKPTIHHLRKTAATNMVIQQHRYPDIITDKVLRDMFGWTDDTLAKMKRIYVSDAAVIAALTNKQL